MPSQPTRVDLAGLFQNAATALESQREALNEADGDNHNHGDNMVSSFQTIASAVAEQPEAGASEQLSHAAQVLGAQATSGSGQMYAQNLSQAAEQLGGQDVTSENALGMIGALLGSQPGSAATAQAGAADRPDIAELLGGLLGGMSGGSGGATAGNPPGFDLQDLLALGAGYLQAKNEGKDDLQAIAGTLLSASGLTGHRQQSGQIVVDSMLTDLAVAGR